MPTSDQDGLVQLAGILAKRRRVTIGVPLVAGLVTALAAFLIIKPWFTATTTFVPEASGGQARLPAGLAGLAGLAGQFGISFGSEASKSPRFYAEVVKSRQLMERVLLSHFADPNGTTSGDSASLLTILNTKGPDSATRVDRAIKKLRRLVNVGVNPQTGIVGLSVDARYPDLAAAVANRLVTYLNAFNAEYRQSQAREQRRFVEQRTADGERELRRAEEELRTFYERNRSWEQAPQLVFEEGRLRRQVDIRQEVYLTLKREYETARIQEVNDTPVITVIDVATPPVKKSRPKRSLLVAVALVLGTMVGVAWAVGAEYVTQLRRRSGAADRAP